MEQNGTPENTNLSRRQLAAMPFLVAGNSVSETSRLVDIGRTTLYRWLNDDEFRTNLEELRSEAADLAKAELKGLMLKSAIVMAHAMEDANPTVRLIAARAAMSLGLKAFDLDELRHRVERLDDAVALHASRKPWP